MFAKMNVDLDHVISIWAFAVQSEPQLRLTTLHIAQTIDPIVIVTFANRPPEASPFWNPFQMNPPLFLKPGCRAPHAGKEMFYLTPWGMIGSSLAPHIAKSVKRFEDLRRVHVAFHVTKETSGYVVVRWDAGGA